LNFDIQGTWTFEDTVDLFDFDGEDTAFSTDDFNGTIGDPDFTANARLQWVNGDWRYTWFTDFTSRASNDSLFDTGSATTYYGEDAYRKIYAEPQWYHGFSVQYRADTWAVTAGIDNLFDEAPPAVTTGATTRRGIVPLVGTQYDYRLRSGFLRVSKSF
ncbi:MAG: TonB-dependent receptor, partial [Pseudomonadota bacterium]|nr:TonB-dependent receptor [Pseudomonadota bacterium]